jgi:acetyl esterase
MKDNFIKTSLAYFVLGTMSLSISAATPKPNEQMKAVLKELQNDNPKPIPKLSAEEARKQPTPTDAVKDVMKNKGMSTEPEKVGKVENKKIMGAEGEIPARFYYPQDDKPAPVIVYFHGGGWVIAGNDVYDASVRALVNKTNSIVVAIEYRQAPEHKFPAAHEDAFAAYKWVVNNAKSFGGNPDKIAVAGESAGGNLAVNVAIKARDEKIQMPEHVLSVYPIASGAMNTESYKQNADAKPLDKPMMGWFMEQYLSDPKQAQDPRINLVEANLKGLPPTTIITASVDPLKSEGKKLAEEMEKAGVPVEYKNYDGVTHEFFGMAPVVDEAKQAQEFAAKEMKESFKI